MSDFWSPIGYQLGLGGIGGFIIGYAFKMISKLIVALMGVFIAVLLYLGTTGVISINYPELWSAIGSFLGFTTQAANWIIGAISLIPFTGSFIAGFFLGFKLG